MHRRNLIRRVVASSASLLALAAPLCSQTHKVTKPENVTRAVGVYEWTGDMAKPNAMRLIPVSLFINSKLEDAAVYLSRPVPFALLTGNVYEVQQSGVPKGVVELSFARHFQTASAAANTSPFDDGWFGYGRFVPPAALQKSTLKPSKTLAVIDAGDDDSRPHFSSKSATPGSGGSASNIPTTASQPSPAAPPEDPDRPTLHRPTGSSTQTTSTADTNTTPPADPDRPTLHRPASPTDPTASSRVPDDPSIDDPDRPSLRRRSPTQTPNPSNTVSEVPSLNADPNRPTLHRGKPAGAPAADDYHPLAGLPPEQDLHQMVAVSDPANRPLHDFARQWDDNAERQAILTRMESAAQAQLATYNTSAAPTEPAPGDTRHPNSKLRRGAPAERKPTAAPPQKLLDEQLNAYTLSYGASAVFVFTAHTEGEGATLRYVTVVSEVDMQGNPQVVLKSATDATHLDRTPRMRLVDAVDAEASNRASLLFELRAQNSRQFALYRVLGSRADQVFLTGSTQ